MNNMVEEAREIFEYLPISKNEAESLYIEHLWGAFAALCNCEQELAKPFAMMPFHLLFMYALQCKVLRIAKNLKADYDLAFTMEQVREDHRVLYNPTSAFEIALLNESKIIDLLKLLKLDNGKVKNIKSLVRNRNDRLAHAKGEIEPDPEGLIQEYLDALRSLQPFLHSHNNKIAEGWDKELTNEDDLKEFVDLRLLDSQLSVADFRNGILHEKFNVYEIE